MKRITVSLTNQAQMNHVPLAALGYALRHAQVLAPLETVGLPLKTVLHTPQEKLQEALVLVLAGGEATSQANLLLRPNRGLAQAWGQERFAQQATLARALDAFDERHLHDLRQAFDTLMQSWSQTCHHDFRRGDIICDGDLTGLPASRHAEGSTKGFFAGKKTDMVGKRRV